MISFQFAAVMELGNASGSTLNLRTGLPWATTSSMAGKDPALVAVRPNGIEDAPQYRLDIDREKANALGITTADLNTTVQGALASSFAPGFAWEYLRRNSDFQQDRRKLERTARRGVLNQAEADAFARRWGVRFRKRHRNKRPQLGSMGGARPSKRDRPDGTSG